MPDVGSLAVPNAQEHHAIRHRLPLAQTGRSRCDHQVTSETFAKAKARFGPYKGVDLVLLMGNYAGTAALHAAVDMQLHEGKTALLPLP